MAETDTSAAAARPDESRRNPDATRAALQAWLTARLADDADPDVAAVQVPESNGMSSETVLVDAVWTTDGVRSDHRLVARIAPTDDTIPVFPEYDLASQFRVMRVVGELADVPVPAVRWLEEDPGPLGAPFFVMDRVEGVVPPDVLPYDFGDNWLYDASRDDQQRLEDASIDVLVRLHAIGDPERHFDFLAGDAPGDTALRRHVAAQRTYYDWVSRDGQRSPLIERTFDWLDANWPEHEGPTALSWGDARIGNMMYRDFEPVAVLDWEMAGLAPRELDLSWTIFLHRFFEDIATQMGLPGMPWFLHRDRVCDRYAELSGHTPANMEWHLVYAALRHAVVMSQVQRRAIAFGAAEQPEDVDDLIMHRGTLEEMLEGRYWDSVLD